MTRILLAGLALALACPVPAHALKASFVGAGTFTRGEAQGTQRVGAQASLGGGGLLEVGLLPSIGLEIGALYVPRKFDLTGGGVNYQATQNLLQVPVVLRANLLNVVSIGVGGYVGRYLGNPTYEVNSGSAGPGSYGTGGLARTDYGTLASLAFYSSLSPLARLVFDARYVIGGRAEGLTGETRKFRDVQVLVGLQVGL